MLAPAFGTIRPFYTKFIASFDVDCHETPDRDDWKDIDELGPHMSNPKEKHYWTQLRAALTAGQWRSTVPAKAPNGTPLSWSELFRKFNKHCRGYQEVAEAASRMHALALLLSAPYLDDDEDVDASVETSKGERLDLSGESTVAEERKEEAEAGYKALKAIGSSKFDVRALFARVIPLSISLYHRLYILPSHTTHTRSEMRQNVLFI